MTIKKLLHLILVILPILLMLPAVYISVDGTVVHKALVLVLIVLVDSVVGIYMHLTKIKLQFNQMLFITITMALVGLTSIFLSGVMYLYMPILLGVMLVTMMIDKQLAIMLHFGLLMIVSITLGLASVFFVYYGIIGLVAAMTVNYAKERNKMLVVVATLAVLSGLVYGMLAYVTVGGIVLVDVLLAMANSVLTLIIVIGSLPLWESIFNVMTPLKLLEFANSDHKLMQMLLAEAPGTYHHSQMVGNLAERAAKSIGADGLLAKTGAAFHDIGKLKDPKFFIENQNGGPNPHDEISADASARIIIEHVAYGEKLAQDFRLPIAIVNIIKEHQGTTVVKYFYSKALNYKDGVTYDIEQFRYGGPKPQTKESAIVMLADCVEAFVRSLSEEARSLEKIRWIIEEIIRQKFEENQLDESPLQVSELKHIGNAFMEVYNGLYHERIAYPGKVNV